MTAGPERVSFTVLEATLLTEDHAEEEDDGRLDNRVELPHPEHFRAEEAPLEANSVEPGLGQETTFLVLVVEDAPEEEGGAREANVVDLEDPGLVEGLPGEDRVEAEEVLDDDVEEVFVEVVAHEPGDPAISLSTVEE